MTTKLVVWATTERSPVVLCFLAAMLGAAAALVIFGWDVIVGDGPYWTTAHDDSVKSVASISYYLNEGWSWPALSVAGYGYPEGVNLVFTDSIPLLALGAKALRFALPAGWHYLGYWLAICCVLQAVSMVVLLIGLGWRNMATALFGSGFALGQTVFLSRYFHAALMAQFLVIFAIAVFVYAKRSESHAKHLALWSSLAIGSLLIHPYLFAMVSIVAVASLLQLAHDQHLTAWVAMWWVFGTAALVAGLLRLMALGALVSSGVKGFGFYSMNLLAPLIPRIDATGGQYEGSSYLGLGILGLLVTNLVISRRDVVGVMRRHLVLLGGVALMAGFALSNVVYAGNQLLVEVPLPRPIGWLTDQFRSSGRFIWPLVYIIVVGVLVLTVRRFRPGVALLMLGIALLVQGFDMASTVDHVRSSVRAQEAQVLNPDSWSALIAQHDLVHVAPHQCNDTVPLLKASLELQRLAAGSNTNITAVASARRMVDCKDAPFDVPLVAGELRVVWDPEYRVPDHRGTCRGFALGKVCSLDEPNLTAARLLDGS